MSGPVHFCWSCYAQLPDLPPNCPHCGGPTDPPPDAAPLDLQVWALGHPIIERRMLALAALERNPNAPQDKAAVEAVRALVDSADPYLAARALRTVHAVAGIDEQDQVQDAAEHGPEPVRRVTRDLLNGMRRTNRSTPRGGASMTGAEPHGGRDRPRVAAPVAGSPRPDAADGGRSPNRLTPMRFIVAFGVVSLLADFVYEGARAIIGPYLATFGASAVLVGAVTGVGEAVALVFRLFTGRLSDRTGRYWALSVAGYVITVVAVPVLAAAATLWQASTLVIAERFGKAVRTPARDTMLAQASTRIGRGKAFAYHEALDQSGALLGPLLVAAMVAISGYRLGFAVLAVPGALAVLMLARLRRAVPNPAAYEGTEQKPTPTPITSTPTGRGSAFRGFSRQFWLYTTFTALTVGGYATFGVLSYHLQVRHVVAAALIPVIYAAAMGVDALAALGSGRLYDKIGLRGLVVLPVLTAAVPFLSFSTSPLLVWIGAVVWGAAMGVHESTMRAAVADMVPADRRGTGYGVFTAVYGLAWLAGATIIGALYGTSLAALDAFVITLQIVALVAFVPLARGQRSSQT